MNVTAPLQRLGAQLLDLLLPPACPFCGLDVPRPGACTGCLDDLPWNVASCRRCALPLTDTDSSCATCQRRPPPFERTIAPLRYEFPIDAVLKAYKFTARSSCLPALSAVLCDAARELPRDVDGVLPMPMHWIRWARRGFNHKSPLDKRLARGKAFQDEYVDTPAEHVLIVDDVMTTGQSCRQLALTLRRAGIEEVSVLVVARAGHAQRQAAGARL